MNSKQSRTLRAIFAEPTPANIAWADIERLLVAVGCVMTEGSGSRVHFEHGEQAESFPSSASRQGSQTLSGQDRPRISAEDRSEDMMSYKGYHARVEYDPDDEIFFGRVFGIRDGISFHADDVKGLKAAFHEAIDDYLDHCAKVGKSPQKSYSGQLMLRISPTVHANAALAAERSGKSLNQWSEEVLARAAQEPV